MKKAMDGNLVEDLLAGIIANDQVQSQSFKDLQRIQLRRNKAEDAWKALENLVVINANGEGSLTRCLMKNGAGCMNLDLNYTARIEVPAAFSVRTFSFAAEEDQAKSYGSALQYFNARLPEVVSLLKDLPSLPAATNNSLKAAKKLYQPGDEITVQFTTAPCISPDSWVGIFSASHPHVDDLASSFYLLSGRGKLEGNRSGTLKFKAPADYGAYQLRLFDTETGAETATYDFVVGSEAYLLSGIYQEVNQFGRKTLWKIEVNDYGFGAQFGPWEEKDSANWKPFITGGKVIGNVIMYLNEMACGYGPNGLTAGESRQIPFRLVFEEQRKTIKMQHYKVECDNYGKMKVWPQWDERENSMTRYIKIK